VLSVLAVVALLLSFALVGCVVDKATGRAHFDATEARRLGASASCIAADAACVASGGALCLLRAAVCAGAEAYLAVSYEPDGRLTTRVCARVQPDQLGEVVDDAGNTIEQASEVVCFDTAEELHEVLFGDAEAAEEED
jgi:hypothetical protein